VAATGFGLFGARLPGVWVTIRDNQNNLRGFLQKSPQDEPPLQRKNLDGCPMTSSRATTDDGNQPMTAAQAGTLKRLAQDTYELDAFKPNLTRAEAEKRIITLTAKLKLLGEPPHTL
jgi:hypothetical protein